jgi:HSP20 family protein
VTDATAVPVNVFENDRELMVVAPMPGVSPEDVSIDVTDDGQLTLRAAMHGEGQERIAYLVREWSYGPYERTVTLPCAVDALRANVTYGNGVLSITFPKADAVRGGRMLVERTGHTRGVASGHRGTRGGDETPDSSTVA